MAARPLVAGPRFPQQAATIGVEGVVFEAVAVLPPTADEGAVVRLLSDGRLYRYWAGAWLLESGEEVKYTNPAPTPVTLGGIPSGSTFSNKTMQEMWDALLYPYLVPAFSAFSIQGVAAVLEVGDAIPASVTFTWATSNPANVQPNSLSITDVTDAVLLASGLANDGSEPVVMGAPVVKTGAASHQFRIDGTDTHLDPFSRTATYNWRWRGFWGASANPTLTEAQVEALASNGFVTGLAGSYATPAGGYKYFCIPHVLGGQVNAVKDPSTMFDIPLATPISNPAYSNLDGGGFYYALVSLTNPFGITTAYRVYRTFNATGSALTMQVT